MVLVESCRRAIHSRYLLVFCPATVLSVQPISKWQINAIDGGPTNLKSLLKGYPPGPSIVSQGIVSACHSAVKPSGLYCFQHFGDSFLRMTWSHRPRPLGLLCIPMRILPQAMTQSQRSARDDNRVFLIKKSPEEMIPSGLSLPNFTYHGFRK